MVRHVSWALPLALLSIVVAWPAGASVETQTGYTKNQTYNGALRYLRVDLGYEVTEKDPEAAYLLFRFVPTGRKAPMNGSIEIVQQKDSVRLLIHLPELPRYHEELFSEGLVRKLRDEYGEPPRHETPPREREKDRKDRDSDSRDGGS